MVCIHGAAEGQSGHLRHKRPAPVHPAWAQGVAWGGHRRAGPARAPTEQHPMHHTECTQAGASGGVTAALPAVCRLARWGSCPPLEPQARKRETPLTKGQQGTPPHHTAVHSLSSCTSCCCSHGSTHRRGSRLLAPLEPLLTIPCCCRPPLPRGPGALHQSPPTKGRPQAAQRRAAVLTQQLPELTEPSAAVGPASQRCAAPGLPSRCCFSTHRHPNNCTRTPPSSAPLPGRVLSARAEARCCKPAMRRWCAPSCSMAAAGRSGRPSSFRCCCTAPSALWAANDGSNCLPRANKQGCLVVLVCPPARAHSPAARRQRNGASQLGATRPRVDRRVRAGACFELSQKMP